jgi:hypothetical protein
VTNSLAYYGTEFIAAVKSFKTQALERGHGRQTCIRHCSSRSSNRHAFVAINKPNATTKFRDKNIC